MSSWSSKEKKLYRTILALRLLCDYSVFKKVQLYVLFVDFSKAYDRVSRKKMIEVLKSMGCGKRMLRAIQAMYEGTKHILKSATICASVGVRQGAPSSCFLFIMYINRLVKMISDAVVTDGFLGGINVLLLMDDAVILATSRELCIHKFGVLVKYCDEYGIFLSLTERDMIKKL